MRLFLILVMLLNTSLYSQQIHEEGYVKIGSIEQYITINGNDTANMPVLFLHGGPGSIMSAYNDSITLLWQKKFTIVHWDQRGAGRTFGRNAPEKNLEDYWIENPLTLAQMSADAIELSEIIFRRFNKKIIIIATSWGTTIGTTICLQRPELFQAYVGHSQVVNPLKNLAEAYINIQKTAAFENDSTSVSKLKSFGPPPYEDARTTGNFIRIIKEYEKKKETPAPASWWKISKNYNNEFDFNSRSNGDDYSFIHYTGHKKMSILPMMATIDFLKEELNFNIPVYLFQGEHDILSSKQSTKLFFNKLSAPLKEYILIPSAAHGFNKDVIDAFYQVLTSLSRE